MTNNILPLGSVVKLNRSENVDLMIINRGSIVLQDGKEVYFDYGAVRIPQGLVTPEETYFFNQENIVDVVFRGYVNIDEQSFSSQYYALISESGYEKGKVPSSN